jgi:hypothetical protein
MTDLPDNEDGFSRADDLSHLARLKGLLEKKEELDPELEEFMEEEGPMGVPSIRHPLVYSVIHTPELNAMVNESLRQKRRLLQEYQRKRNWESGIWLYERPYRINAFANICWHLGDSRYWKLLGSIYTDTENLWQNEDLWIDCLTAGRRYRSHLMRPEEREALADIDKKDHLVYRGFRYPGRERGLSWTRNPITAKWFARRLAGPADPLYLAAGRIDRKDVIAFFDGRSEEEVVVLPSNVRDIEVIKLPRRDE